MCEVDIEHLLHVFFDCTYVKQCWLKVGMVFDMREVDSFPYRLLNKIGEEPHYTILKIATVLWGIWFVRNKKLWENKSITPDVIVDLSLKQVLDWQIAM